MLDHPSTAELSLVAAEGDGNRFPAKLLVLPLRSDFGDLSRIIGCLSFPERNYLLPVRMEIRDQRVEPVEITRQSDLDHPLPGFYEGSENFDHATGPGLRKVVDNRVVQPSGLRDRPSPLRLVHSSAKVEAR